MRGDSRRLETFVKFFPVQKLQRESEGSAFREFPVIPIPTAADFMLATVLSSQQPHEIDIILPFAHEQVDHKEVLARPHPASKWQGWDFHPAVDFKDSNLPPEYVKKPKPQMS